MAIDYHLKIDTEKTSVDLMNIILQIDGFRENERKNDFFAEGLVGGIWTETDDYDSQVSQNLTYDDFGFRHKIVVWLTPYRDELEEAGMHNMMKAIMTVLQQDTGDAVVLMNNEYVILTRIAQKLALNSESFGEKDKWWNPKEDVPFFDYELTEPSYVG